MVKNYPKHIAIILDGNRRWAKGRGLKPWQGHLKGYENVKRVFDWIKDLNIKEVTLYGFSLQNKSRDQKEVKALMNLFTMAFRELLKDQRVWKNKTKIRIIGRRQIFPQKLKNIINEVEEKTKNHDGFVANFALAYGGREEITDAVKKITNKVLLGEIKPQDIDEKMIEDYLNIQSSPDILIRTGGEQRISNFLLWQMAYSELFFIKKHWPDFTKDDLVKIIDQYLCRERRFGK